ncbi:MAG: nucleoside triphosphate pyrophosphohydrolase [Desulfobacteraceae bacterium]|nr:nucleoside triphosphate pyrophosphohydrolase [Desulfobacteraceae bacterium]
METIVPLLEIIRRLRGKNGCAWDQKQTPLTMWKCVAEELYELEEAIVNDDTENICEELGDVLFQILFVLEIFTENNRFEFSHVIKGIAEKMIRRHPHVYDTAVVKTEEELHRQWDQIKAGEKNAKRKEAVANRDLDQNENIGPVGSALDSVPKGMPGLLRALKVSKSAVKEGFDWENIHQVLDKVKEEIQEFEAALEKENQDEAMMEFGDILFSLVNVARFAGFHPETALSSATAKFEGRFRLMETALCQEKIDLKKLSLQEKQQHWQRAKLDYAR